MLCLYFSAYHSYGVGNPRKLVPPEHGSQETDVFEHVRLLIRWWIEAFRYQCMVNKGSGRERLMFSGYLRTQGEEDFRKCWLILGVGRECEEKGEGPATSDPFTSFHSLSSGISLHPGILSWASGAKSGEALVTSDSPQSLQHLDHKASGRNMEEVSIASLKWAQMGT